MRRYPNLILGMLLVVVWAIAAWQGQRVQQLRDADLFYRWIVAACTQSSLLWELTEQVTNDPTKPKMMDRELFESITGAADKIRAEVPVQEGDLDKTGAVEPKLVRLVKHDKNSREVWNLASGSELASQREEFRQYWRQGRLASAGVQLDVSVMYASESTTVSLANMFLGFRKMAANLIWLEVDKYWHAGMLHRMVPLMNLTVTLDPNFVDAFLIGAWHLAYNATASLPDTPELDKNYYEQYGVYLGRKELYYYQGVDFLKDGIRKNPSDYRLYFDLGYGIYSEKLHDYANAVRYLEYAVRYLKHDKWVPRTLNIAYQRNSQYQEAIDGWKLYLQKFPANPNAQRFIMYNEALLAERDMTQAREKMDAAQTALQTAQQAGTDATTLAAAQANHDAAKREYEAKFDLTHKQWQTVLASQSGADPLALGHLRMLEAQTLADTSRYYEAIAVLSQARIECNEIFNEVSDRIMALKEKAKIPLNASEKMEMQRRAQAERIKSERETREKGQQPAQN